MPLVSKRYNWPSVALVFSLLLFYQPERASAAVLAAWSSLNRWTTSPYDNYTEYTFRYKTFDPVRLIPIIDQYKDAEQQCLSTQSRLPRLDDLAGELFQRFILKNPDFRQVGVTKEVLRSYRDQFQKIRQWSMEPAQFFLASSSYQSEREKQLVDLEDSRMVLTLLSSERSVELGAKQPTIIMCVKERQLPRPPPPPPPPPPPVAPSSSSSSSANVPCTCGSGVGAEAAAVGGLSDFAWPLAAVAFLGVLCLSLATALLVVCRASSKRRQADEAAAAAALVDDHRHHHHHHQHVDVGGGVGGVPGAKNGNSIPRTASSLMDFPAGGHPQAHQHYHMQEKAHSLAAQATMPRRPPRVIHNGQVHTNGYLTLGSIQARKQRELMQHPGPRDLGLSEPPSPNHSIARSDYQHR